jgi:hypothetical protein
LLKGLLLDIINLGKFSEDDYIELLSQNPEEADLFDTIIQSSNSNVNSYKHKSAYSKLINDDIKRFNLIKAEILQLQNNNPELLKELRIIILRLLKYNVLSKEMFHELMLNILLLL